MPTPKHERAQIRDAVIAALKGTAPTYATAALARVGPSRLAPQRGALLPAINVYAIDEVTDGVNGNALRRTVTVAVDAWVNTVKPEDLDNELDAICRQIEAALDADPSLGLDFVFRALQLDSTELGLKLETECPQGCAHLEYSVIYETDPRVAAPSDDFLRVDAKNIAPAPSSEDLFNVR